MNKFTHQSVSMTAIPLAAPLVSIRDSTPHCINFVQDAHSYVHQYLEKKNRANYGSSLHSTVDSNKLAIYFEYTEDAHNGVNHVRSTNRTDGTNALRVLHAFINSDSNTRNSGESI